LAIAALYPFWGAILGAIPPFLFPFDFVVTPTRPVVFVLAMWLIASVVEERALRVPFGRHILGAGILCLFWFPILKNVSVDRVAPLTFATQVISRSAAIVFVWISRPDARGMALSRKMNRTAAAIAIGCAFLTAVSFGIRHALVILLACFLILRVCREAYYKRLGGINPTAISLTQHATEISTMLIVAFWR
jgi:cobalamin synthase